MALARMLHLVATLVASAGLLACSEDSAPDDEDVTGSPDDSDAGPSTSSADGGVPMADEDAGVDGESLDAGRLRPQPRRDAPPDPGPPLLGEDVELDAVGGRIPGPAGLGIVVPPDALDRPTTFNISEIRTVELPDGLLAAGPLFELRPIDQTFDLPVRVAVPLALGQGAPPPDAAVRLLISYDEGETWEAPYVVRAGGEYRFTLQRLGIIALVYQPPGACIYTFTGQLERGDVLHIRDYTAEGTIRREAYELDRDADGEANRTASVGFRYDDKMRVSQRTAMAIDRDTDTSEFLTSRTTYGNHDLPELWIEEVSRASPDGNSALTHTRTFQYERRRLIEQLDSFDDDNDGAPDRTITLTLRYDEETRLVDSTRIFDDNVDDDPDRIEQTLETYDAQTGEHLMTNESVDEDGDGTPESSLDTLRGYEDGSLVFQRIEVREAGEVTHRTLIRSTYIEGRRTETVTEEDEGADLVNDLITRESFNAFGQPLLVIREVPMTGPRMPEREITTFTYDPMLSVLLQRVVEFDAGADNTIERKETWTRTSDEAGRPLIESSVLEANGDGIPDSRTSRMFVYDDGDRLLSDITLEDVTGDGVFDNRLARTSAFSDSGLETARTDSRDEGNDGFAEQDYRADLTYEGDCDWLSSDVVTRSWDTDL